MQVEDRGFESFECRSHTDVIDQVERFSSESWMESEYVVEVGRDLSICRRGEGGPSERERGGWIWECVVKWDPMFAIRSASEITQHYRHEPYESSSEELYHSRGC